MVESCYRCDKANICAVGGTKGEMNQVSAAAIGLSVLCAVVLGGVIVYLLVKVKRMGNIL